MKRGRAGRGTKTVRGEREKRKKKRNGCGSLQKWRWPDPRRHGSGLGLAGFYTPSPARVSPDLPAAIIFPMEQINSF